MMQKIKKLNILKRGPVPHEAKGFRSGFVILFAVVISSIILSITLGVANIALKEIKFSTSAKETNYSFFAADTGIECALFNDKPPSAFPLPGLPTDIACASGTPTFVSSDPGGDPTGINGGTYTLFVVGLGNTNVNCAKVTVLKTKSGSDILTTVISKGYNTGGENASSCANPPNPSRIEREIKVTY